MSTFVARRDPLSINRPPSVVRVPALLLMSIRTPGGCFSKVPRAFSGFVRSVTDVFSQKQVAPHFQPPDAYFSGCIVSMVLSGKRKKSLPASMRL